MCFKALFDEVFAPDIRDRLIAGMELDEAEKSKFLRIVRSHLPQAFEQNEREYTLWVKMLGYVNSRAIGSCRRRSVVHMAYNVVVQKRNSKKGGGFSCYVHDSFYHSVADLRLSTLYFLSFEDSITPLDNLSLYFQLYIKFRALMLILLSFDWCCF